jgi:hypothetical protein
MKILAEQALSTLMTGVVPQTPRSLKYCLTGNDTVVRIAHISTADHSRTIVLEVLIACNAAFRSNSS